MIQSVRYTSYCDFSPCGLWKRPQYWLWPFAIKKTWALILWN
jgi:hypothetical protein